MSKFALGAEFSHLDLSHTCNWYLLADLGCHANAKPSNIHFLTTSNKVSLLDQCVPIVEELLLLESEGIDVYYAFSNCQVRVVAPLLYVIYDNPRAKELCNQLASSRYQGNLGISVLEHLVFLEGTNAPSLVWNNRDLLMCYLFTMCNLITRYHRV